MRQNRNPQERNHFVPRLEPLEDRLAPATVSMGNAAQVGSMLVVGVANPGISTTTLVEDGQGDVAVAWNGLNFSLFSGISYVQINAEGQGNIINLYALAPLQTPEQLSMTLTGLNNALLIHLPSGGALLTAQANVPVPYYSY